MKQTPVEHDTFTVERTVAAPVARVFEAFANPDVKARWFVGPASWKPGERRMDFRVGGREHVAGEHSGSIASVFDALYLDIVPGERIVYVYEMTVNGRKISASLATVQLIADGQRTRIVLTEQGAYFADPEMAKYAPKGQAASRLEGTNLLWNQLAALFAA
jgi:uncharacterized protein YndB with AHSA1/START domain